jgi:hypothetical protein
MKISASNRLTGISGIIMYLLVLLEITLYFVYTPTASNTPPRGIVVARILVDMFLCVGLIGFFSGFRDSISQDYSEYGWLANFMFGCGLAFAILALVADSMQIGSVWAAGNKDIDPTWVGSGGEGSLLIYGPVNRLMTMVILITGSALMLQTGLCSRWIAWLGFSVALYQLCFIPTIFHMTTPMDFYSVNGWNIPIAAGLFFLWILIASISLLRRVAMSKN